jgi:hypothetical protein
MRNRAMNDMTAINEDIFLSTGGVEPFALFNSPLWYKTRGGNIAALASVSWRGEAPEAVHVYFHQESGRIVAFEQQWYDITESTFVEGIFETIPEDWDELQERVTANEPLLIILDSSITSKAEAMCVLSGKFSARVISSVTEELGLPDSDKEWETQFSWDKMAFENVSHKRWETERMWTARQSARESEELPSHNKWVENVFVSAKEYSRVSGACFYGVASFMRHLPAGRPFGEYLPTIKEAKYNGLTEFYKNLHKLEVGVITIKELSLAS